MWQGEVIALFPEIPGTFRAYTCLSYAHIGQHSACDCDSIIQGSKPARTHEYENLFRELTNVGYDLVIRKRMDKSYYRARIESIRVDAGIP